MKDPQHPAPMAPLPPLHSDPIQGTTILCASPESSYRGSSTDSSNSPSGSPDIDVVSATPFAPLSAEHFRRALPSLVSRGGATTLVPPLGEEGLREEAAGGPIKRYLCQRCLNHNEHWPRKGHKPFCRYAACSCRLCRMVDERRRLNNAICRQTNAAEEEGNMEGGTAGVKVRNPMCARCSAHGVQNRLRGHKKRCPYATCDCDLCKLVDERRELMARQIKLRRHQKADIIRQKTLEVEVPANHPLMVGVHRNHFPSFLNTSQTGDSLGCLPSPVFSTSGSAPTSMLVNPTGSSMHDVFSLRSLPQHHAPNQGPQLPHYHQGPDLAAQVNNNLLKGLLAQSMREQQQPMSTSQRDHVTTAGAGGLTLPVVSAPAPPPAQQTVLVPVPVPTAVHDARTHSSGSNGQSHAGCIACLEEALRHELKMAELLRLLAATAHSNAVHTHHMHSHSVAMSSGGYSSPTQPISADMAAGISQAAARSRSSSGSQSLLSRATSYGELGNKFPDFSIPTPPSLSTTDAKQPESLDSNAVDNFYRIMHQHPNASLAGLPLPSS